jgi:hypothetical protein
MHGRLCCPTPTRKANAGRHSVHAHVRGNNKKQKRMNNIIKTFAIGLFIFACTNNASAQWDADTQNRIFVVINPEGCPIYSDSQSGNREIIDTLPFGKMIVKTDIIKIEYDTFYCGSWTSRGVLKNNSYSTQTLCAGYWLQINNGGKSCFIWDGFLRNMDAIADSGFGMVKQFYQPEFRSDFVLLLAGTSYQSDFKFNPEWNWYGLSENGCNSVLYEITGLSHFISIDGDKMKYSYFTSAYSSANIELEYIIGSKNKLTPSILMGSFPQISDAVEQREYLHAARLWVDSISKSVNSSEIYEIYAIGKNNKKQKLEAGISQGTYGGTQYGFERVLWFGDIDNDFNLDYIIRFYSPEGDEVIRLFVSSAAKNGDLVAPVSELIYFEIP